MSDALIVRKIRSKKNLFRAIGFWSGMNESKKLWAVSLVRGILDECQKPNKNRNEHCFQLFNE